jgi:Electron transfer DM13
MKIFPGRRRSALAVVAIAALAGLGAGIALGHSHSGSALAQGPPRVLAKGTFRSLTWNTEGTASLVREPTGQLRLKLSSDFTTKHAPELYVYLAKLRGQQRVYWKLVGTLRSSQGAQEYAVSAAAASTSGLQVAVYCAKCNQVSALAQLQPVRATS